MGTLPTKTTRDPAIDLAEKGYVVTEKQAKSFKRYSELFVEVNGKDTFFAQGHQAGDTIVNPALAKTLKAIAEENEGFYDGWVAQAMVIKPSNRRYLAERFKSLLSLARTRPVQL